VKQLAGSPYRINGLWCAGNVIFSIIFSQA
jgi:hypothetical protein